jgi:hypothetical protein
MRQLRTPEDVCVEYAIARSEILRLTKIVCANRCSEEEKLDDWRVSRGESCLRNLWYELAEGRSGYSVELCQECQNAQAAITERKVWRKKLGIVKRAINSVGKRLMEAS